MTPEEALELIKVDAGMQWEPILTESDPSHGSRLTEENFWSPNIEAGRKVRVSSAYVPFSSPNWMTFSGAPLTRWEDSI